MTWQQAQEKARPEAGINSVFAPESQAVIGGYEGFGFFILVPQGCVFANTADTSSYDA
jgi:hypothetical protein